MKKVYLLALCLAYTFIVFAGPVSEKQALEKARQFMPGKSFSLKQTAASNNGLDQATVSPYYVFNAGDNAGFVIVSGDDRTRTILGYSDEGTFDLNNLPENVAWWLGYYTDVISSLGNSSVEYASGTQTAKKAVAPLIQTKWSQGSPYNDQCVFNGDRCVTGCVATAMAQVLYYYQYPNKVAAIDGYTTSTNRYDVPALPGATLDWKNMCLTYRYYDERTDAQKAAIATLMRYCGQAVYMNYTPGGSGGKDWTIPQVFANYFGFAEGAQCIYRSSYDNQDVWEDAIYQELAESYPVIYTGFYEDYSSGHCFVIDGYKDGLYHVNWGWGGSCDGHFVLSLLNPDDPNSAGYSEGQRAIVGVRPLVGKVKLSKTKATIETGKTLTLKPTVSPEELLDKSVTWKSSNKKVATVTSSGKVKGVAAGTATITCTSQVTGAKATCKVTVGSITLSKSEAIVKQGKTLTLKATVLPSTDTSVTWESSDEKYVTVTADGKVKGVKVGRATVTCTSKATGLKATCQVTVGLVCLNKYKMTLKKGKTETLTPTVYPKSLEDKSVTWTSSNTKIATVTAEGKVKGVKTGTATITCTSNATGLSRSCEVTVVNLTLDQYEVTVKKGKTVTLTATVYPSTLEDKSVTWESSDTKIATVTSAGKVKGVKAGTATITCTSTATGLSRTCKVTVGYVKLDKTTASIEKGKTVTLTATVYPSTLEDKSVTWESSNTKIATVTTTGKVKGIKAGTATITCTSVATGLSTTCTVTVTASSSSRSVEGNDDDVTGIEQLEENSAIEPYDVYDLSGRKVLQKTTSLDGLPEGVYIVNGQKVLKK